MGAKSTQDEVGVDEDEAEATRIMEQLDQELAEQKKKEDEQLDYIKDPTKGKVYTEKKIQEAAKPCWTKLIGYLGSFGVGGCGPIVGFLII